MIDLGAAASSQVGEMMFLPSSRPLLKNVGLEFLRSGVIMPAVDYSDFPAWLQGKTIKSWQAHPPTAIFNSWRGIAFGNGTFVAVGVVDFNSFADISSDGIAWTRRPMNVTGGVTSIAFGNGTFVALTSTNDVATSTDGGVTWSRRLIVESANWSAIAYGNGKFVAVGVGASSVAVLATSPDGITWTKQVVPVSDWATAATNLTVVFCGDRFFVHGRGSPISVSSSPDGVTWTKLTLPLTPASISYGNGVYVAETSAVSAVSEDGYAWVKRSAPALSAGQLIFGAGVFVVISGDKVHTSTDGINWVSLTAQHSYSSIAFGNGTFVALSVSTNKNFSATTSVMDFIGTDQFTPNLYLRIK
ncbi:WD40/YVTN/BNR-like repeat-containing protein [Aeromonas veronii]|uniref:DUF6242 domain-containing protein n=1 Tax=Aeromonas veronii TaxID=654 RepID=A0A2T4N3F0_AERVE|nr:hypothetical protein [Aeromonas veronii]MCX0444619.1 hypothetical protein [Aeromonas veronii]PTH81348.1 hypothetical protein DAA48_09385 [Aeromonas veronii]RDE59266.1 hypothetical protein DV708_22515 [Aeromonas veronii]